MGGRSSSLRPEVIQDLMNETEFSQTEIRDLYRQFMEDCRCKHGKRKTTMKMGQFKRIYSDIFPEGDSDKFAEHVFRTFDRDKTGKIDFREFVTSLSMTLKGTPEEKLSWAFDLYDIDNCGRVTRQEAETIVSTLLALHADILPGEEYLSPQKIVEYIGSRTPGGRDATQSIGKAEFMQCATVSKTMAAILEGATEAVAQPYKIRMQRAGSFGKKDTKKIAVRKTNSLPPKFSLGDPTEWGDA